MARFRLTSIGQLARQMCFASAGVRAHQIDSAETLLYDIEPDKAYPLDFIVFRITGYHPREVESGLLTGVALQHDLGLLIEIVSDSLKLSTGDITQPVLSIDDLTARFNVTSKTIQRWRRKGLSARRFTFPDGKRRVGFLLHSVERFIQADRGRVVAPGDIRPLSTRQCDQIVWLAQRLLQDGRYSPQGLAYRIARKLRRSPLSVLHTLNKHDQQQSGQAVLTVLEPELTGEQREMIVSERERGSKIAQIAAKMGRCRSEIYRVILENRIGCLLKKRVNFHDDPLYHQPDALQVIEQIIDQGMLAEPVERAMRIPQGLSPYLAELYRVPLLSPAVERGLFLKLNFHKYQFVSLRRKIDLPLAGRRELAALESMLSEVVQTRNQIVRANLRLVVSVARKHLRPRVDLMELISEGNLMLMRAANAFDVHRRTRFSTYATFALMKGFARAVPQLEAAGRAYGNQADFLSQLPDRRAAGQSDNELFDRDQVQHLLERLNERERRVLREHYGLGDRGEMVSHTELAEQLGLSRQRVRQIEIGAIRKLRELTGMTGHCN